MDLIMTNISKKAEPNFGNTSMMLKVIMAHDVFLGMTVFPVEKKNYFSVNNNRRQNLTN